MGNLKILKDSILNINEKSEVLATAHILPCSKDKLFSYIDNLIKREINDIREYDGVSYMSDEDILKEYPDNFNYFYEFKDKYKDLNNLVYLDLIENKGIERGSALTIVNYLKNNYEGIILYSMEEAIEYWKMNGFESVLIDGYYFFSK